MTGKKVDAGDVLRQHKVIMAAVDAGRVSPRAAITWARRAVAGEDIGILAHMTPGPGAAEANRDVRAHTNQQVLRTLTTALVGPDPEADVDPQYLHLFPPPPGHYAPDSRTLVYDPPDEHGNRPAPHTPYASAGRSDRYDDADLITDDAADSLWPPATESDAARHAAARAALRPLTDDELYGRIFDR